MLNPYDIRSTLLCDVILHEHCINNTFILILFNPGFVYPYLQVTHYYIVLHVHRGNECMCLYIIIVINLDNNSKPEQIDIISINRFPSLKQISNTF